MNPTENVNTLINLPTIGRTHGSRYIVQDIVQDCPYVVIARDKEDAAYLYTEDYAEPGQVHALDVFEWSDVIDYLAEDEDADMHDALCNAPSEIVVQAIPAEAPPCNADHSHEWHRPHEVVGGCEENPGVFASSNAGISITEVCQHCGCKRITTTRVQLAYDPRQTYERTEYQTA